MCNISIDPDSPVVQIFSPGTVLQVSQVQGTTAVYFLRFLRGMCRTRWRKLFVLETLCVRTLGTVIVMLTCLICVDLLEAFGTALSPSLLYFRVFMHVA